MFRNFPLFPEQASDMASRVDNLFFFLLGVSAFFAILIAAMVVIFAIKYRRRSEQEAAPRPIVGSLYLELAWTGIPLLIAMVMFGWGASVYFSQSRPPAGSLDVYVVGKQWMWKFQHPTGQREINQLHVPINRPVRLIMASEDVIHSFFVPAFRVKADVVPGHYRTTWFEANKIGTYHLFCAQYCGTRHSNMIGEIVVMKPGDYERWISGGAVEGSASSQGEKLFQQYSCFTCHRPDGSGRAPSLVGLYGKKVDLTTGQVVTADEGYIRESIVNPQAKIVAGYGPIMPTFQGQISEEGIIQLIEYIKSLSGPQTGQPTATTALPAGQQQPAPMAPTTGQVKRNP